MHHLGMGFLIFDEILFRLKEEKFEKKTNQLPHLFESHPVQVA